MPNSFKDYDDATASTTSVTFTTGDFEYLDTAHIKVIVTDTGNVSTEFLQSSTGQDTLNPPFSVAASSGTTTVTFNNMNGVTGDGLPANTTKVRVQRVTPSASLLTTFQNASLLRADDLNDNAKQLLFVLQEQVDAGTGSLPLNAAGFFDAGAKKIANIADGTSEQDVASFGQLSALSAFSADAPTVPQFTTFAGTDGTFANGNTTFNIPFTPLSEIDATYICEVGGVVQVPGSDFTVAGTVLTVLGRNCTNSGANAENIAKIVLQSFGVTKSVFNFPTTGTAASNSETPITLKGAASGDGTAMLSIKDSGNVENASITAGGNVKAKVVEPNAGGDLAVNPSTITTTGTITSGGNLTVGSASITQATGDATVNNLTISSATQTSTQAVPKSYVDAFGGFEGSAIGADTDLDTVLTPGLYTGTVNSPSTQNYPSSAGDGELFVLRVTRAGGLAGTARIQEFLNSTDNQVLIRKYDGSSFSAWTSLIRDTDSVNNLSGATADFSMNSQKIINLADNTAAQDAVTQNHLQTNYKNNTEILDFMGKNFGPFQARAFAEPTGTGSGSGGAIDNGKGGFVRLSGTLNQQVNSDGTVASIQRYTTALDPYNISSGITIVNVTSTSSDPETWDNSNTTTGGNNDTTAPYLIKITPGLGPLKLQVNASVSSSSVNYDLKINMYTNQDALTAHKTTLASRENVTAGSTFIDLFLPNLTETRFFGLEFEANFNNQIWGQEDFYVEISRAAGDVSSLSTLEIITP
ncbi:MAG: putative tail fiber protein [Prokaryotic dsDNA virus sp.]|nr:MAG: putative tail fiber protein [Prokaryotic dsDNA virus sp.]|tara:strand:+ start:7206 stop:9464 length:2259 start_codon:yes stop_codon:yes gene_type:complete